MRKGFIFAGLLIALITSYLFYRSCKRDTLVIAPADRVSIPDSSWLYGSLNLSQIKKDIAWSTLLHGDFSKILRTDTSRLLKLFRSPDTYAITEQDSIRYFAVWKDSANYKGLLFTLKNNTALKHAFKSDSFQLKQQQVYSFRTVEGFWMYDAANLLFVSGPADSLTACSFFTVKNTVPSSSGTATDTLEFTSDPSVLISGHMDTRFVPERIKSPLLDSTRVSFRIMSNDDMLDINWTYKGFLTETVNQSSITHQNNEAALFCAANLNKAGIEKLLEKIPSIQQAYIKEKAELDPFLAALNNNNASIEFNGWKKIKSSYYTSVLNDEFETVLQKKDSSIIEPIFKISLEQSSKTSAQHFLSYLQKEGLVSKGKQQPFALILGNFDSELNLNNDNTFILHNKHTPEWARTPGPHPIDAALYITVKPDALKDLYDAQLKMHPVLSKLIVQQQLQYAAIHVEKKENQLTGNTKIKFTGEEHPFIALMKMVSSQ